MEGTARNISRMYGDGGAATVWMSHDEVARAALAVFVKTEPLEGSDKAPRIHRRELRHSSVSAVGMRHPSP